MQLYFEYKIGSHCHDCGISRIQKFIAIGISSVRYYYFNDGCAGNCLRAKNYELGLHLFHVCVSSLFGFCFRPQTNRWAPFQFKPDFPEIFDLSPWRYCNRHTLPFASNFYESIFMWRRCAATRLIHWVCLWAISEAAQNGIDGDRLLEQFEINERCERRKRGEAQENTMKTSTWNRLGSRRAPYKTEHMYVCGSSDLADGNGIGTATTTVEQHEVKQTLRHTHPEFGFCVFISLLWSV